jgi:hypothetical protein
MLQIRPIGASDIDDVARVHVRSWQSGYAGIVPAAFLNELDPAEFAARRRYTEMPSGGGAVCAVHHGEIIGHAAFGPYRPASMSGRA